MLNFVQVQERALLIKFADSAVNEHGMICKELLCLLNDYKFDAIVFDMSYLTGNVNSTIIGFLSVLCSKCKDLSLKVQIKSVREVDIDLYETAGLRHIAEFI